MQHLVISLQETIDFLPEGVLLVQDHSRIVLANTHAGRLFGYEAAELTGAPLEQLIPARFHPLHAAQVSGFFAHPSVRRMGEGRALFGLRRDGTEFDVNISLSPVLINGTAMVVAVVRDTTAQQDLARALQFRNEQLEAINVELERFGVTISHDLKSPLANLHAIMHLITRELPPDKKVALGEHLHELNHTLYSMSDLIAGVAAYSKATLADAVPVAVEMDQVLADVRALVLLPPHVALEIAPDLPPVWGNRTKLLQIFLNLISNAIKYNNQPVGHVRVSGTVRGEVAHYWVDDNGPGIDPALREKVFTLFEKGTSTRSDSEGIGLAIVHKNITALGGRIRIDVSPLGGARFTLVLPAGPPAGVAQGSRPG